MGGIKQKHVLIFTEKLVALEELPACQPYLIPSSRVQCQCLLHVALLSGAKKCHHHLG